MLVLHGIYGSGTNWRTFGRRLVERRPDWGLVLVDLRMHGRSQGAAPPHTIAAAAADLVGLVAALGAQGQPVRAVCGHSFGGKVALQYRANPAAGDLVQTWVIDASPSASADALDAGDSTVFQVLHLLERLPHSFADRSEFIAHVEANGFAPALGHWLAMNLERRDRRYAFGLDLAAMEALLQDYHRLDAWPAVISGAGSLHVVIAGESNAISAADRQRLDTLAAGGADVTATIIAESDHWVHIDAPDRLLDLVAGGLPPRVTEST